MVGNEQIAEVLAQYQTRDAALKRLYDKAIKENPNVADRIRMRRAEDRLELAQNIIIKALTILAFGTTT